MNNENEKAYGTFNYLLVDLFNDILSIEERVLRKGEFKDLSMRDFHIIEQMARMDKTNMTALAKVVRVTKGTLTVAIDNLVRKGYVERIRKTSDRRMVEVWLTDKARRAEDKHAKFHDEMINDVIKDLSDKELEILEVALNKVNGYFIKKYDKPYL
jgi:DNA-binding MarR family transcriptional regulator